MGPYRDRLRVAAAVLLVVATGLLVVGTCLERSQAASKTGQAGSVRSPQSKAGEHDEAAEQPATTHNEATERATGSGHNQAAEHTEAGEEVLGINPEGLGLTVAAAVLSLLLAGLLLIVAGRQLLWAVVLFALAFVALDLRESVHQASEARTGLLAIALLTAIAHLGVAGLAGARLRAARLTAATP